jgi:hypothetical protein
LDKAFNEDNQRTFEMLDEKHPVTMIKLFRVHFCGKNFWFI